MSAKSKRDPTIPSGCRDCGEGILWVKFYSGKKGRLNAEPTLDGPMVWVHDKEEDELKATKFYEPKHKNYRRYEFHQCPNRQPRETKEEVPF